MKALTIHQPWAALIAAGVKRVENRTWQPPHAMIGDTLAIHAAKKWDPDGAWRCTYYGLSDDPEKHASQAIVATARVIGVVIPHGNGAQWILGDERTVPRMGLFLSGPYGWVLDDPCALPEPIACRGYQGLWNVPDEIARRLR